MKLLQNNIQHNNTKHNNIKPNAIQSDSEIFFYWTTYTEYH